MHFKFEAGGQERGKIHLLFRGISIIKLHQWFTFSLYWVMTLNEKKGFTENITLQAEIKTLMDRT